MKESRFVRVDEANDEDEGKTGANGVVVWTHLYLLSRKWSLRIEGRLKRHVDGVGFLHKLELTQVNLLEVT